MRDCDRDGAGRSSDGWLDWTRAGDNAFMQLGCIIPHPKEDYK
jgi:hypothetical protein